MISLNRAEGHSLNELLSVCDSYVAVQANACLAGVIWLLGVSGASGNWVHALLTSGVRVVTGVSQSNWHSFCQSEHLVDRAHRLVSLERLPIKLIIAALCTFTTSQ